MATGGGGVEEMGGYRDPSKDRARVQSSWETARQQVPKAKFVSPQSPAQLPCHWPVCLSPLSPCGVREGRPLLAQMLAEAQLSEAKR